MSGIRTMRPVEELPTSRAALLSVDERHPFFFDHPLDHVPGIQLAIGLLDLLRDTPGAAGVDAPGGRLRLSLSFPRLCELDREVRLRVTAAGNGFQLRAEQDGEAVCEGSAEPAADRVPVRAGAATAQVRPAWAGAVPPAPAQLVHRDRPENVTVGALDRSCPGLAESRVLSPPSGHVLLRDDPGRYSVEELLEAGRQQCVMLGHLVHGRPLDAPVLWLTADLDVPCGLPRTLPLVLRWAEAAPAGARARFALTLGVAGGSARLGTLSYASHTMSRRAYERKRLAAARAGAGT